jgi:hypothetical protein
MRILKVMWFARWARHQGLGDAALRDAVDDICKGLIDADLGGGLVKKRIARAGQGKSSGYRVIIAVRVGRRACFLYGFAKNQAANIKPDALADFKKLAAELLGHPDAYIDDLIDLGELIEVER